MNCGKSSSRHTTRTQATGAPCAPLKGTVPFSLTRKSGQSPRNLGERHTECAGYSVNL